ncbi:MAG: alpha/beta hydrolase [Gemmatimonadales bacterium]|nr:alpha/beta hydrolase [Gemmatimonadales bacterium]
MRRDISSLSSFLCLGSALLIPVPAEAQSPAAAVPRPAIHGSYRGAFVRNGSVQLVDAQIGARGDSLLIGITSPDRPGRVTALMQRDSTGRLTFRTWNGPARLAFDSVNGELIGPVGAEGGIMLHLRRMAALPQVELSREEITYSSAGAVMAATILRPVGIPVHAAIVFVAGRGCATRESGLRRLEQLAQYGIGGIAADTRGSGRSGGNCRFGTIDQFTDDAVAALAELRKRFNRDSTRFGFWGNSAGGWVVVQAHSRAPVDFLITSVGPATSVEQQQRDNATYVTRRLGFDSAATARALRYITLMFEPKATQARYDEMMATVQWARAIGFAREFMEDSDIPTSMAGLDSLWVALNRYDPGPVLRRLRIPMLAFFGGRDEVVPPAENVALLRSLAAAAGNDRVRAVVVPDGDHGLFQPGGMQRLPGGVEYWRFGRNGGMIIEEIVAFLRQP